MSDYSELKRLAEAAMVMHSKIAENAKAAALYGEASEADVVLALIAEKEAYASRLHEVATICATAEQERDQLKAENEALRKDSERLDWLTAQGEIEQPGQGDVRGFIDAAMIKEPSD